MTVCQVSSLKEHLGKTYVFRNGKGSWDRAEDMPTARDEIACGPVKGWVGGPLEEVVVAGGCADDPTSVVEIFNTKLGSWRTGEIIGDQEANYLPIDLQRA